MFAFLALAGIRVVGITPKWKTLGRKVTNAENKHWISNELSFKTPEGCDFIAIYVFTGKGTAESRVFVDNIYLERGK